MAQRWLLSLPSSIGDTEVVLSTIKLMGFTTPCLYSPQVELVAKPVISVRGSAEAWRFGYDPETTRGWGGVTLGQLGHARMAEEAC